MTAGVPAAILEQEDKGWQRGRLEGVWLPYDFMDPQHQPWATYLQTSFVYKKNLLVSWLFYFADVVVNEADLNFN